MSNNPDNRGQWVALGRRLAMAGMVCAPLNTTPAATIKVPPGHPILVAANEPFPNTMPPSAA